MGASSAERWKSRRQNTKDLEKMQQLDIGTRFFTMSESEQESAFTNFAPDFNNQKYYFFFGFLVFKSDIIAMRWLIVMVKDVANERWDRKIY